MENCQICTINRESEVYLTGPPPPSTIHLGEDSVLFVGASIVFFGGVDQKLRKFWVTIEGLDAFEYITVVKLICLPCDLDLLSNKLWKTIWEFLIDDLVKFVRARK